MRCGSIFAGGLAAMLAAVPALAGDPGFQWPGTDQGSSSNDKPAANREKNNRVPAPKPRSAEEKPAAKTIDKPTGKPIEKTSATPSDQAADTAAPKPAPAPSAIEAPVAATPTNAADARDLDDAQRLAALHDTAGARAVLDSLLQRSPQHSAARAMRAALNLASADYDAAIVDLDAAIKDHQPQSQLFVQRGLAWQRKGNLDRAAADFELATKIDASDVHAWHTRALLYALRNQFDLALADNARALAIRPNDLSLTAWRTKWESDRRALHDLTAQANVMATVGTVQGPPPPIAAATASGARPAVTAAPLASLDPAEAKAVAAADYAFVRDDHRQMLEAATSGLTSFPNSEPLLVRHARALHMLKDNAHAAPELDAVLERYPKSTDGYYVRGLVRKDIGRLDSAKDDFLRVLALEPDHIQVQWSLMQVYLAKRDTATAMTHLNTFMRVSPGWAGLTVRLNLLLDKNDLAAAEQDVATGDRWGPAQAYGYLTARGRFRLAKSQWPEALADLSVALAGAPSLMPALRYRCETFERLGNYVAALADARALQAITGTDEYTTWHRQFGATAVPRLEKLTGPQLALGAITTELQKGDFLQVIALTTKEIEKPADAPSSNPGTNPGSHPGLYGASFYMYRATALLNLGRLELALADYDKTITLNPRAENALSARARVLAVYYRRFDNAQTDIDRALTVNPRSAEALIAQAVVYSGRGEPIRALAAADSAVMFAPKLADAYITRAMAHATLQHDDTAMADYATALTLQPKSSSALYLRGVLHAKRGRHTQAITDYSNALVLENRKSPSIYIARGKSYEALTEKDKALADFETAQSVTAIGPIEVAQQLEATAKAASLKKPTPSASCGRVAGDQCL